MALWGWPARRWKATGRSSTELDPVGAPAWVIGWNRWSSGRPSGAPMRWGWPLSSTTWPVRASTTAMSKRLVRLAATLRKLSMVTSKCTIARLDPSAVGISVELEITHSLVSGET